MYDVEHLRQTEFPHSAEITYLNHAGISPLPQRSAAKVQWATGQLAGQPAAFWGTVGFPLQETLQQTLMRHIHAASPSEIVIVPNTGSALNAVAQAIDWREGDNVLFCDIEFPSNAYPWMSLERDGVEPRLVPPDNGGLTLATVERYADEHTRLVAVSAVQFFTGHRTDLHAIGRFCRDNGILLAVDAIQSIGHIPVDVQAMNIDILATGGMKSLLALPGTGFLYVRQAVAETMRPRLICSTATVDYIHWLAYDLTFQPAAARFSSGTTNLLGIFSMQPSLELLHELGVANIDAHTSELSRYACAELSARGLEVITPGDALGPIVTFRSPYDGPSTDRLVADLGERHIAVVKHLDADGQPYIRLSFHCYNIPAEIDRFVEAYEAWSP